MACGLLLSTSIRHCIPSMPCWPSSYALVQQLPYTLGFHLLSTRIKQSSRPPASSLRVYGDLQGRVEGSKPSTDGKRKPKKRPWFKKRHGKPKEDQEQSEDNTSSKDPQQSQDDAAHRQAEGSKTRGPHAGPQAQSGGKARQHDGAHAKPRHREEKGPHAAADTRKAPELTACSSEPGAHAPAASDGSRAEAGPLPHAPASRPAAAGMELAPEQRPAARQKGNASPAAAEHAMAAAPVLLPGSGGGGGLEALVALGLEPQTAMEALSVAGSALGPQRGRAAPRITALQAGILQA